MKRRIMWVSVSIIFLLIIYFVCINIFHLNQTFSKVNPNSASQRGNTLGNMGGFAGAIGDWIYYVSLTKLNEPYNQILCRENIKTGKKEKISNDSIRSLNLLGEWVYFSINDSAGEGPIYRMKLDGSEKKKLNEDQCGFINVVDNYIYYINYSDGFKIYRMKTDGSERKKLNDERSWSINVVNKWIFYSSGKDVYKMSTNGKEKVKLFSEDVGQMIIDNDWIYYFTGYEGNIYKIRTDGTGKVLLTKDLTNLFNLSKDNIYYNVRKNNKIFIYRVTIDGKNSIQIAEGAIGNIIGNWIYTYKHYEEFMIPVRFKIDGTSQEILHVE